MVKSENIKVGSKVVVCLDGEDFEGAVVDVLDGLAYVELAHNGKQHRVGEVKMVLSEPEDDDDKPNPAPEKGYVQEGKTEAVSKPKKTGAKKAAPEKPLSLVNAAHKVLLEENRAMSCPEMAEAAIKKGYWKKGTGKTPAQTLYAAILRELKTSNERFQRAEVGGKFRAGS